MLHNVNNINAMAQQQMNDNRVRVSVRGWEQGGMQDLLNYVSKNARISIQNASIEGPLLIGFVNSRDEANKLLKWNGARFAGKSLKFEVMDQGSSSGVVMFLRECLYRRYDAQNKMLDLSSLHADPELYQKGVFSSAGTKAKLFPAILKLAEKETQLVVESVNLSDNQFRDISNITTMAQAFPKLKNLCLANNQIARFKSMEVWKNKFKELRELLMTNNPIVNERQYKQEMLRLFPKLVILDGVVVRDMNKLDAIYNLPVKLQQFFFENNELGQSSTDFVTNFLNLWDTDRTQLLGLYTPQSQFSLSADSTIPPSTVRDADSRPSFGHYVGQSRNICKVAIEKNIKERLAVGQEAINNLFKSLPKSKHHLQDRPNEYAMEAIAFPPLNGFMITLHGFFEETGKPENDKKKPQGNSKHRRYNHGHSAPGSFTLGTKSFDRTWIIVPMNNSVVIASDLLTIRAYSGGAWVPEDQIVPPVSQVQQNAMQNNPGQPPVLSAANSAPLGPSHMTPQPGMQQPAMQPAMQPGIQSAVPLAPTLQLPPDVQMRLNNIQLELLNKLHLETKLNAEYTYMLAEQSGWNYENATKSFQGSVSNIPPGAFVQF